MAGKDTSSSSSRPSTILGTYRSLTYFRVPVSRIRRYLFPASLATCFPQPVSVDASHRAGAAFLEIFPDHDWLVRFYKDSQKWGEEPFPRWFEDWLLREQEAATLRIWQPLIIPGLLQTAEYARALFLGAQSDTSDEAIDALVTARLGRQRIFDRSGPPNLLTVLDESVLYRLIGSPKNMYGQLIHVAEMSERPCISVQVVPAITGAHAGLSGGFMIATVVGTPDLMHIDAVEGVTIEKSALVGNAAIAFDRVRGDALPRSASRDLILRVAEERWNSRTASTGVSPATAATAAQTASK